MAKDDLTPEVLRALFIYSAETGTLHWVAKEKQNGTQNAIISVRSGYAKVRAVGRSRLVHRICWIIENGKIEEGLTIDHINGDRLDNRLCNLRLATVAQNNQNIRVARRHSKSGIPGVSQNSRSTTWRAKISINGKQVVIGSFKTKEQAGEAFIDAKRKHHMMCTV